MSKLVTLLLITVLLLSNLILVESVFAQSIPGFPFPEPTQSIHSCSSPEFTVSFVGQPYDVPTTYGFDPYTGEPVTHLGYHVINGSIKLRIKNQPFDSSSTYRLYYEVRSKGHFETNNWTIRTENRYVYSTDSWSSTLGVKPSGGEYTIVSYPANYPPNAKVDFQVQAIVVNMTRVFHSAHPFSPPPFNQAGHYEKRPEYVSSSDWSKTQTVTIPGNPPKVTLLSLQNANFSTSDVPLNFTVDPLATQVKYSLDGGENVTVAGNATLTELTNGYHNVTVYATDEFGNTGASETIYFNVEVPFPTQLVVASVIGMIFVGVGLLAYFKKRKH